MKELRITNTECFSYSLKPQKEPEPRENRRLRALPIPSEHTIPPAKRVVEQVWPDHGRAWPFTSELHGRCRTSRRHVLYLKDGLTSRCIGVSW